MDVNGFAFRFRIARVKGGNRLPTLQCLHARLVVGVDGGDLTQEAGLYVIRYALRLNGILARGIRVGLLCL